MFVAGLIHFSDAEISTAVSPPNQWQQYQVAVGQPKPSHGAFYPARKDRRKFYHHHPGAQGLVPPHPGIRQTNSVRPAPSGTCFEFTVDFMNLRDDELNLLLYCLVLEEDVTVNSKSSSTWYGSERNTLHIHGSLTSQNGRG